MTLYRCICKGCKNLLTTANFTCFDCFLYCDHDVNKLSKGHRMKVLLFRKTRPANSRSRR